MKKLANKLLDIFEHKRKGNLETSVTFVKLVPLHSVENGPTGTLPRCTTENAVYVNTPEVWPPLLIGSSELTEIDEK